VLRVGRRCPGLGSPFSPGGAAASLPGRAFTAALASGSSIVGKERVQRWIVNRCARHENNDANAGHKKPRAKLTGAAGNHTSTTRRVRHCWLADIDIAATFVRHNMLCLGLLAMTPVGSSVPGFVLALLAVQLIGSHRTCFPAFHHDTTLADYAATAAGLPRCSCFEVSGESSSSTLADDISPR
jgi:hypothetical protein